MAKKNNVKKPREMSRRALSHHEKAKRRQRWVFFGGIGVILAVVLIILGGWFAGEYMPLHATVMTVYDKSFSNQFFIDTLVVYGKIQGTENLTSMASSILDQIKQNEIIRVEAEKLGIIVTDQEAIDYVASTGFDVNDASIELSRASIIITKLQEEYFGSQVSKTAMQYLVKAMLVEGASIAETCKQQLLAGGDFAELVEKYAVDTTSKGNSGDYGWHPMDVFENSLASTLAYAYLSGPDMKVGEINISVSDDTARKQVGYWLIRVNERPDETSADVTGLLIGNEELAKEIRTKLLNGEDPIVLAEEYTQFNATTSVPGELGVITSSDSISAVFNEYTFNQDTPVGEWSEVLKDEEVYTKGGVWVIWVEDEEADKELSTTDYNNYVSKLYNEWLTGINSAATEYVKSEITEKLLNFAISKATDEIVSALSTQ